MRTFIRNLATSLIVAAGLSLPALSYADDTEIYFAKANAENSENKPTANVMIMLDTSGSMRNCETGTGSTWCKDIPNRRITLLHNAMKAIINEAPPAVNIGLGRFQSDQGGQILLPVMPVNDVTRPEFLKALNNINGGQNNSSPGNVQPAGSTPTSRAYEEMANYILGNQKSSYVDAYPKKEYCVAKVVDEICTKEPAWGESTEVDWCDTNLPGCVYTEGTWRDMDAGAWCDLTDTESCRAGNWSEFSIFSCSPVNNMTCKRESRTGLFGITYNVYSRRGFSERSISYHLREQAGTVEVCETVGERCTDTRRIVDGNEYVSPVNKNNQCETNHIILFTDGAPSADKPSEVDLVNCGSGNSAANSYSCQVKIAEYLNDDGNSIGRVINTHNIGLYMESAGTIGNMEAVSQAGGGQTYDSDSAETLLEAFRQTLDLISDESRSISSPGVAVNSMNRFQHLDELYYAVFQPAESSFWEGNLKRYQLKDQKIYGQNGVAVDETTGYFHSGARSFWSSSVDGADANKGGARENVGTRKLFYTDKAGGAVKELSWSSTDTPSNSFFGLTGGDAGARRSLMLDGLKTMWGDPMHGVPLMVNYGKNKNYVIVSTNGGMLHVIDTSDGNEVAAFMPYELFNKARQFTIDKPGLNFDNTRQTYGLDGSWIAWRKPGETLEDTPEKVYIYGGMRRGGKHYYALDVTTPSSPKMKWQINGGDEGFEQLGQTWSTPTLTKVKTTTGEVPALIFGGGYSPEDHDGPKHTRSTEDQEGNAVYIVNAETGKLMWSALATNEMKWAIPGGISVVDIDFDGVADHLYFGDLGGQLFRADMSDTGLKPSVTRIANLGGSGADHRRFYEAPAVAYAKAGVKNLLYVVAGSGYRAHPLDEDTNEGIFVVIDDGALQPSSAPVATLANMANVVTNAVETTHRGWYYLFEEETERSGEKSLSSPVIFDNTIMFTTYAPTEDEEQDNPCAVRYGGAYLHTVHMRTGAAASLSGETPASRSQPLDQSTPPPTPTLLVDENGDVIIVVGPEVVGEGDLGDPNLRKRRWMQLPKDEANKFRAIAEGTLEEEETEADD